MRYFTWKLEFVSNILSMNLALDNLEQNIWKLFHVLAQFLFTRREIELDYYHQKVKFQENLWNAWIWWRVPSRTTKSQILTFLLKTRKKSAVKHSMQKPILLNFANLFTNFCPGLIQDIVLLFFQRSLGNIYLFLPLAFIFIYFAIPLKSSESLWFSDVLRRDKS